jgi:hypothetical protein
MNIEKLYQDVWTQVFALTWDRSHELNTSDRSAMAANAAHAAAAHAVHLLDPSKAHAAICDAQGLAPQEGG